MIPVSEKDYLEAASIIATLDQETLIRNLRPIMGRPTSSTKFTPELHAENESSVPDPWLDYLKSLTGKRGIAVRCAISNALVQSMHLRFVTVGDLRRANMLTIANLAEGASGNRSSRARVGSVIEETIYTLGHGVLR